MPSKILGILGGMGPDATCYIFNRIIRKTNAQSDSDHIEIVIHNNTRIPDRTRAILHGETSPVRELVRSARLLQEAGAGIIIIPCMTAHYFFDEIASGVRATCINAIEETARYLHTRHPHVKKTGVMSTTGTFRTNLFQDALAKYGIDVLFPSYDIQERLVMGAIYGEKGIKAGVCEGEPREKLLSAAGMLVEEGAEAIVAGCTEIPLALHREDFRIPFIEPMEILADLAIQACNRE